MKIAVADDEQILLVHLQSTVKEALPSAEVMAFSDTASLFETAKNTRFDIAFLDIQMPGLTGIALARELTKLYEKMNIIFVTGYDGYQAEAMELFASGYVKKPITKEKVEQQLEHLRYPVTAGKRVYAQTFGNFTLFIDGKPVPFPREKSQMAVAYLIHRRGSLVSKKELSSILFDDGVYDENRRSYLSKLCTDIQRTLEAYGAAELLERTPSALSINCELLDCDLYDYLDGKSGAARKYRGEYMSQYSFGEEMIPLLEK